MEATLEEGGGPVRKDTSLVKKKPEGENLRQEVGILKTVASWRFERLAAAASWHKK